MLCTVLPWLLKNSTAVHCGQILRAFFCNGHKTEESYDVKLRMFKCQQQLREATMYIKLFLDKQTCISLLSLHGVICLLIAQWNLVNIYSRAETSLKCVWIEFFRPLQK
jgi:hypothetical protein